MNEMLLSATILLDLVQMAIEFIPKKCVTEALGDFHPSSLCSMTYKIFAKLICNHLASLLPKLVSLNQEAFIRGRSIFDNISLTQEVCREIGRPGGPPNLVLTLDMHKAYDHLQWDFYYVVLHKFDFADHWVRVIKAFIGNCSFSVIFNGKMGGSFVATRGLHQSDPLPLSLFILAEEVLSRALNTRWCGWTSSPLPLLIARTIFYLRMISFSSFVRSRGPL